MSKQSLVVIAVALNLLLAMAVALCLMMGVDSMALLTVLVSVLHIVLCGTLLKFLYFDRGL